MTALIYILREEFVCLAMDSLCLDLDRRPHTYTSKFFLLPHLQCIICGTGFRDLVIKRFEFVQTSAIFRDVVALNKIAPENIIKLTKDLDLPDDEKSTIYHFGVDKSTNLMCGYAYRSGHDYESEKLTFNMGVKPHYEINPEEFYNAIKEEGIDSGIVKIITRLKEIDDDLELEKRLGIGGEIHKVILDINGMYSIETIHKFSDYEEKFTEMIRNIHP